jgi:serine O-acetyltransferase
VPLIPKILKAITFLVCHCVIPPECTIGKKVEFWHHGLGVIIHPKTRIGDNCNIYNHVVLGGGHDGPKSVPTEIHIGDNVTIGSGAKVLCKKAPMIIGANSTIAANAVVVDNVPEGTIVGGIPAKILRYKY